MKTDSSCIILLTGFYTVTASAGSTLELATTEYGRGAPIRGTVTMTTEEEALRLDIHSISSNEAGSLVYNKPDDAIVVLDHVHGEYFVISRQRVDAMAAQVGPAMQEMQTALDEMPPDERAVAEQVIQSRLPQKKAEGPAGELRATGETELIAGLECRNYDVMQGEHKFRDLCVTSWDNFPEGQEVAEAMVGLGEFFTNLRRAFSESGGLDLMDRQQDMFQYMKASNGYPVRSREYTAEGALSQETILKSASHQEIDASIFAPPDGYRVKSMQ